MLGDWVSFFLALALVPVLYLEESSADVDVIRAATVANAAIWLLFAIDYIVDLVRAIDRGRYVRSHWFDLAIVVVSPPLLVPPEAQALRVLRVLRLLRALAVIGILYERLARPLTRSAALAVVGLLLLTLLAGGLAITSAEPGSFSNVLQGYLWAIATLMTWGHATPSPQTIGGHAIETTIVVLGLGSFVALASSIGSAGRRA